MSNIYEAINDAFWKTLEKRRGDFIKKYAATSDAKYLIELEDNKRKTIVVLLYERGFRSMDMFASYGWYDDKLYPLKRVNNFPKGSVKMICNLKQVRKNEDGLT